MSPEQKAVELQKIIDELAPIVAQIEAQPETSKGHYTDYMRVLNCTPRPELLARVLILAGANRFGVTSALSLTK